jgi:aspartokinase
VNRDGDVAVKALRREFQNELEKRRIDKVSEIPDIAIIALVGEGMKGNSGIAAKAFAVLGGSNINILMIAQGSSELSLSLVVRKDHAARAVELLHDAFELGLCYGH